MKLPKSKKSIITAILFLCLAGMLAVLPRNVKASDAKRTHGKGAKLSQTTLTIYPNMSKQLKLDSATSDVTWSSTDSKLVSILGSRGTNQETVTIKSGNKTGSCKIKAELNGKTFTCKVTVKKDSNISRARLVKVNKTSKKSL
ncbi:MAG TPA: hypothetical protein DF613_07955 [Lachnospiraceae bacterium]|nr:hypothetical protein [Lachnospiraceae bacterium]